MSSDVVGPELSTAVAISLPRANVKSTMGSTHSHISLASSSKHSRLTSSSCTDSKHGLSSIDIVEGIPHITGSLDARQYKTPQFAQRLLDIFHELAIPSWHKVTVPPSTIHIHKVSGALTNAVFFVSSPSAPFRTLLLRIYGPSSGALIARPRELHILHVLSSTYHMGPRVYGTFDNGRIEEYFDSVTLTVSTIRESRTSAFIGARMAELHGVDIDALEPKPVAKNTITSEQIVSSWTPPARRVLDLLSPSARADFDLDAFLCRWELYITWLKSTPGSGADCTVFCHNDAQYGNILRLKKMKEGTPEHLQIIVVDFEYAAPNPAAYDISNHFQEWTYNYHGSTPHLRDPSRYPTAAERENFYTAYLSHREVPLPSGRTVPYSSLSDAERADELVNLERQVRLWSVVTHATWALWGLVQARDDVEAGDVPEFDYIAYARCRFEVFHAELDALALGF
ncbi:kinase-like protein [Vararia minispora EC-137]|uniref:Kinase-like protein n=1 Tax=Vararia minispora EC-137 TaxID=1314806 RepID=A0ACB8QSU8_9AGAM|nr:kinase-like protein [Vararia minispora EC-137]